MKQQDTFPLECKFKIMLFGIQEIPKLAHLAPMSTLVGLGITDSLSGCQNLQSGLVHEFPYRHGLSWVEFIEAEEAPTFEAS